MDYKAFNIAVHENGHNVEQDLLHEQRGPLAAERRAQHGLHGGHRLRLPGPGPEALGQPAPDAKALAEKTLNDFWAVYEIAGVGLVDTAVRH